MTQSNLVPQGNYHSYLMQIAIKIQQSFEHTDIDYYQIKDKIGRIECVKYNTTVGRDITNEDYVEYFSIV